MTYQRELNELRMTERRLPLGEAFVRTWRFLRENMPMWLVFLPLVSGAVGVWVEYTDAWREAQLYEHLYASSLDHLGAFHWKDVVTLAAQLFVYGLMVYTTVRFFAVARTGNPKRRCFREALVAFGKLFMVGLCVSLLAGLALMFFRVLFVFMLLVMFLAIGVLIVLEAVTLAVSFAPRRSVFVSITQAFESLRASQRFLGYLMKLMLLSIAVTMVVQFLLQAVGDRYISAFVVPAVMVFIHFMLSTGYLFFIADTVEEGGECGETPSSHAPLEGA